MIADTVTDEFDLHLTSGRIHASRVGPADAPLVLLVHGLSAHMHAFDYLVEKLADENRQLVAIDLRGRGRSETTPAGTYGLAAHCNDILEVADQLDADQFDLVGWSLGALIGIHVACRAPARVRKLVLIDHAGQMDPGTIESIANGLARLDMNVERPSAYVEAVRAASGISPWTSFWDRYFEYEIGPEGGAFKPTTSKFACLEDLNDVVSTDWPAKWNGITMPALLLRCKLAMRGGFVVPEVVRDQLQLAVKQLEIAEVDSDHYTVMTSEVVSSNIRAFLDSPT